MKGTVNYDGATSEPFDIHSGVKQGCVLAPTLFSILFSMVLSYAFNTSTEGVFLHTRADGKLFNLARLRAKTKVRHVVIREMLFADDAALMTRTMEDLQQLIDKLSYLGLLRILHDRRRWPQWSDQRVRIASPCPLPGGVLVRVLRSCIGSLLPSSVCPTCF